MVLIPLAQTQLPPTAINVPGPGPNETHSLPANLVDANPADAVLPPPPPETKAPQEHPPQTNGGAEEDNEGSDVDDDDDEPAASRAKDPYSNLDGAFGNYLADEPRPMGTNARGRNDIDDLLF